jgi:hypothetical protein
MIAAFVAEDIGVIEFGVAIFIALVVGVLIWNLFFLVLEALKDKSRRKVSSRANDNSAKIVPSND